MVVRGAENTVMHASLRIGETMVLGSDGRCEGRPSFQGFALSLTAPNESEDESEGERLFASLGDGGQGQMPLRRGVDIKPLLGRPRREEYRPSRRRRAPTAPGVIHRSASRTIFRWYSRVNRRRVAFATTSISGPLPGGRRKAHSHAPHRTDVDI
jgi:hypothetical protein